MSERKQFNCEACGAKSAKLEMRHSDGLFVCPDCVPASERRALAQNLKQAERGE